MELFKEVIHFIEALAGLISAIAALKAFKNNSDNDTK